MVASILFIAAIFALAVAWVVRSGGDTAAYHRALRVSIGLAVIAAVLAIAGAVRWSGCLHGHNPDVWVTRGGQSVCARPALFGLRDPWVS